MAPERDVSAEIDEDFRIVFTGEHGERVLRFLMDNYWVYKGLLDPDSRKTAFNEGQRAVVLDIIDRVRVKWKPMEFAHEITQTQVDYHAARPATDPSAP